MEASAIKTFVMSTDVDLSADFISKDYVFTNESDYKWIVKFH